MRRTIYLLFYFLIVCLRSLAAQQPAIKHWQEATVKTSQGARDKEVENQIVALEKRLWNGDAADVAKLEADDYEATKHAHRYHRSDDEAAAKNAKFALVSMDDIRLRLLGPDVALLTYHANEQGTFRGMEVPHSLFFGSLWVKRNGEWKNVFLEENLPDTFTDTYKPGAEKSVAAQRSITTTTNEERYIRDGESQWAEAVANGDVSVVQRILADDFIGVDAGDGHLYPKAESISWIQAHHSEYLFNHLDEVKVRFFGNTAVAQGSESWERRTGEPRRGRFVWTDTWVLRNGQWQIVAAEDLIAPPLSARAGNSDDDLSAAKQQVLDLEQDWVAAEVKHDATTLRRILDDKFVASFGAEKPYDKEAFIKAIASSDVGATESQTLTDRTVIIDHDTAVVVGTDTLRGTKSGAPYMMVARYTVTYIHRNGHWVALAEHLVEVPQAK